MDEEWGPWIEHDGKGCPVAQGMTVQAMHNKNRVVAFQVGVPWRCLFSGLRGDGSERDWIWGAYENDAPILAYRIRKPKALRELIDMVENLPLNAKEDA